MGEQEQAAGVKPEIAYRKGHEARKVGLPIGQNYESSTLQEAWLSGWQAATSRASVPPLDPSAPHIVVTGSPATQLGMKLRDAFERSLAGDGGLDPKILSIRGMSGKVFRTFLNGLVKTVDDARYLETGVFQGATLCSAIWQNRISVTAIDNWSEYGGPANAFYKNLGEVWEPSASITILNRDFRKVNYSHIGKFNVHLFDGPHQYQDQYDGARLVHDALDDTAIFIVDDWNWEQVRSGTERGLLDSGVRVLYSIEVRTTLDNSFPKLHSTASDWHNGVFMAVIQKSQAG